MTTIIQGINIQGFNVYDSSFNSAGALLYLNAGNTASYAGSGTTWTDLSTNTNNATLTGSPTFTNVGTASYFSFNGTSSQYASTVTNKYNQTYTGKTTLIVARMNASAWTAGVDQYRCLFGSVSGNRNFNTYIHHDTSNNYQIHFSAVGGGGLSNNISLAANQWFVVAVTETGAGLVTYYLNGQAVGTTTGQTLSQWATNGGEAVALSDNYWYGDIGVVAVYGRALNASEIQQNYNAVYGQYFGTVSSGLQLYLDANSTASYPGSGTTWYDLSGQNNNVVMQNSSNITYTASGGGYFTLTSNGYFNRATTTGIPTGNSSYTLSAWIQMGGSWGNGGIIGIGSAWGSTNLVNALRNNGNNSLYNYWWGNDLVGSSSLSPVTQWFNVVAKFDGTTRSLWVNGAQISSDTPGGSHNVTTSALGIGVTNNSEYLNGKIGQVLIYNRALAATEIQRNYTAVRSRYGV